MFLYIPGTSRSVLDNLHIDRNRGIGKRPFPLDIRRCDNGADTYNTFGNKNTPDNRRIPCSVLYILRICRTLDIITLPRSRYIYDTFCIFEVRSPCTERNDIDNYHTVHSRYKTANRGKRHICNLNISSGSSQDIQNISDSFCPRDEYKYRSPLFVLHITKYFVCDDILW